MTQTSAWNDRKVRLALSWMLAVVVVVGTASVAWDHGKKQQRDADRWAAFQQDWQDAIAHILDSADGQGYDTKEARSVCLTETGTEEQIDRCKRALQKIMAQAQRQLEN